ncbi:MAG: hypothetical protein CVT48_04510, partial [Thermoplasmata archaeon HGW-Thermoplasmata-1]
ISGWEISVKEDYANAVRIENTDAYAVIRNVKVSSEKGNGIKLFNAANVKIESSEITDSTYGIHLNLVSNVNISTSMVCRNYIGIYLYRQSDVDMYWNAVRNKDVDLFNDDANSIDVSQNWFGSGGAQPKYNGNVSCPSPLDSLFKTVGFYYDYAMNGTLRLKATVGPEIFSAGCEWDLGDGNMTSGDEAVHEYSSIRKHTVTMRVWNRADGSIVEFGRLVEPGTEYWPDGSESGENPDSEIEDFPLAIFLIAAGASVGIVAVGYVILKKRAK